MSLFEVSPKGDSYTTYSTDGLPSPVSIVVQLAQQKGYDQPRVTEQLRSSLSRSTLRIIDYELTSIEIERAVPFRHGELMLQIASLGEQILVQNETGRVQPPLPDEWVDELSGMVEIVTTVEAWEQYKI